MKKCSPYAEVLVYEGPNDTRLSKVQVQTTRRTFNASMQAPSSHYSPFREEGQQLGSTKAFRVIQLNDPLIYPGEISKEAN